MRRSPLLLAVAATGCFYGPPAPPPAGPPDTLELDLQDARRASGHVATDYVPKVAGRLDDLGAPVIEILRQLPGVVDVEVLVSVPRPSHRIIHLRDYHFVPVALFVLDQQVAGRNVPPDALDGLYHRFQQQVELVQLEQTELLRCLAKKHALTQVLAEGLTATNLKEFQDSVVQLKEIDARLSALIQQAGELGKSNPAVQQQIDRLLVLQQHFERDLFVTFAPALVV